MTLRYRIPTPGLREGENTKSVCDVEATSIAHPFKDRLLPLNSGNQSIGMPKNVYTKEAIVMVPSGVFGRGSG